MLSQLTIPKKGGTPDHSRLYAIGLEHVQQLSNQIWTDYNVHDPGITILELLSYALTDLEYRASFPMKDLLASPTDNLDNMARQFFTARQIFPNMALNVNDYRKILIDQEGVKNAWLHKRSLSYFADTIRGELLHTHPGLEGIEEVEISGLYDITIDYEEFINTPELKEATKQRVLTLLHANRNLCEDFVGYHEIETQLFNLCAEIELEPDANVSEVKAAIYFRVSNYLSPPVHFYSLSDMVGKTRMDGSKYTPDQVFEGPVLTHGFIDTDELDASQLRTSLRLSDIISEIMDIKGVIAVRDIILLPFNPESGTSASETGNKWVIPVEEGKKPVLNIDFLDDSYTYLKFFKRNIPVFADLEQVVAALSNLKPKNKILLPSESNDFPIPMGKYRNPGSYLSFQNHFPAIYGLGEEGLDAKATEKRQALAFQLKGYLLFYDQLLANYFAQIGHIRELFTTDPEMHHTYFTQVVDSFNDFQKIYKPALIDLSPTLETISSDQAIDTGRRNRFLDHLISRFAERFNDYASIVHQALGSSQESIAAVKCDFLAGYRQVSSERSMAYNYTLTEETALWNSNNISGLEFRISKLIGLRNTLRRNLSDFTFTIYSEIDPTPGDEFRFRIRHKDTGKIILSSSTNYTTEALARAEMRRALKQGMLPSGYERKRTIDERFYFNIIDGSGEVIARRIEYFTTEEKMNAAIDSLIFYLQDQFSDEGMYLVENILLRPDPEHPDDPFLPICTSEQQTSCSDMDPYSYRIHFILPAENGRFRNMQFRQFVESVIREETPAHILPKVCWISKEDMSMLETTYKDWIYLISGKDITNRKQKLEAFIKALYEVKNTYPSQLLRDCRTNEDKFILGLTSLGSLENENI
ncbi:MAG: diguanylate cyclase [Bacteroidales bacterium]|nr:diguanylate cyclase [Bacteroidales bacterium]